MDGKQFTSEYQPNEKWTEKEAILLGNELIEWLKQDTKKNIFFKHFLIVERDLYLSLISYLTDKFSSFSQLIERVKEMQELKLMKYGVQDELNASMTKFVLANHHNYTDKQETTHKELKLGVQYISKYED